MGQQQLLLVILVTIIVGIATVVAINVFGTSAASANEDAVRQDILTIASAAQGWYIKPEMMGGGGNTFDAGGSGSITFNDFNFSAESIRNNGLTAENMNGIYLIDGASTTDFTVYGHPSSCDGFTKGAAATATTPCAEPMEAVVSAQDIVWAS